MWVWTHEHRSPQRTLDALELEKTQVQLPEAMVVAHNLGFNVTYRQCDITILWISPPQKGFGKVHKKGWRWVSQVECMFKMHKALDSIPSNAVNK